MFEEPRAVAEPHRLRHFLNQHGFGDGDRFVFDTQVDEQKIELVLTFPWHHREGAVEAVAEVVERGDGFAMLGFGAGTMLSIRLIRCNLCSGRHKESPPKMKNAGEACALIRRFSRS